MECRTHSDGKHRFQQARYGMLGKECSCGVVIGPETSAPADIVDKLKSGACPPGAGCHPQWCACEWMLEAADEIERLRAEIKACKETS